MKQPREAPMTDRKTRPDVEPELASIWYEFHEANYHKCPILEMPYSKIRPLLAKLVRDAVRRTRDEETEVLGRAVEAAVQAEREACARVADREVDLQEAMRRTVESAVAGHVARLIRARAGGEDA